MTKKGPLDNAEKFYIKHHLHLHPRNIARDINRTQEVVKKFIETIPKKEIEKFRRSDKVGKKKDRETAHPTLLSTQFARDSEKKSVVMTPNASIMSDEKRASFKSTNVRQDCVTKIRDTDG